MTFLNKWSFLLAVISVVSYTTVSTNTNALSLKAQEGSGTLKKTQEENYHTAMSALRTKIEDQITYDTRSIFRLLRDRRTDVDPLVCTTDTHEEIVRKLKSSGVLALAINEYFNHKDDYDSLCDIGSKLNNASNIDSEELDDATYKLSFAASGIALGELVNAKWRELISTPPSRDDASRHDLKKLENELVWRLVKQLGLRDFLGIHSLNMLLDRFDQGHKVLDIVSAGVQGELFAHLPVILRSADKITGRLDVKRYVNNWEGEKAFNAIKAEVEVYFTRKYFDPTRKLLDTFFKKVAAEIGKSEEIRNKVEAVAFLKDEASRKLDKTAVLEYIYNYGVLNTVVFEYIVESSLWNLEKYFPGKGKGNKSLIAELQRLGIYDILVSREDGKHLSYCFLKIWKSNVAAV